MDISLNVKGVSVSPSNGSYMSVDLTGVDKDEIIAALHPTDMLDELPIQDVVEFHGPSDILRHISIETAIDHYGEQELKAYLELRGYTF